MKMNPQLGVDNVPTGTGVGTVGLGIGTRP